MQSVIRALSDVCFGGIRLLCSGSMIIRVAELTRDAPNQGHQAASHLGLTAEEFLH